MNIVRGMFFRGNINGKIILIINVTEQCVTYKDVEHGTIFTMGRKAFEHCDVTRI